MSSGYHGVTYQKMRNLSFELIPDNGCNIMFSNSRETALNSNGIFPLSSNGNGNHYQKRSLFPHAQTIATENASQWIHMNQIARANSQQAIRIGVVVNIQDSHVLHCDLLGPGFDSLIRRYLLFFFSFTYCIFD